MFYHKAALWQGVGGGGDGSISFVSSATGGSYETYGTSVSLTGTQAGDLVILFVSVGTDNGGASINASGYTQRAIQSGNQCSHAVYYKRLTAADTSASVSLGSSARSLALTAFVFRGVNATTPIHSSSSALSAATFYGTAINPPAVTPTVAGSIVLALGGITADTSTVNITATSAGFNNSTTSNPVAGSSPAARNGGCWKSWTSGSVDPGTFTLTYTNNAVFVSAISLVLAP